MQVNIDFAPRELAGLKRETDAYDAAQASAYQARLAALTDASPPFPVDPLVEPVPLTVEEFVVASLAGRWVIWSQLAPASIPIGDWMQRFSAAEQAAALALVAQFPEVLTMWIELIKSPTGKLTHPLLVAGVPRLCSALESAGVIAGGQAATRAAQIMAF